MTRHPLAAMRLVLAASIMAIALPVQATETTLPATAAVATPSQGAVMATPSPGATTAALPRDPAKGPVTNLPLPRFVSIKSETVYARRGPSKTHRIDWIYRQDGLPVEIVAEYGHWRRIRDRDGEGGWVHYTLLSGTRTVIVDAAMLDLHSRPSEDMPVIARLEAGVIARLDDCTPGWCRLIAGGYKGWAPKTAVWGVGAAEIRD